MRRTTRKCAAARAAPSLFPRYEGNQHAWFRALTATRPLARVQPRTSSSVDGPLAEPEVRRYHDELHAAVAQVDHEPDPYRNSAAAT